MKLIRYFLAFLTFAAVFVSCEEEELLYIFEGVSAPSNLGAIFDIADDDTGMVSVTPTGVGASSFEIYWGDVDSETPTVVQPGETAEKLYAEGEFILRIVAVGPSGLTSELSRVVTISFTPPTNLSFDAVISNDNPFEVSVSPTADNAAAFDIFWGDAEDETPTTIMATETATHIYAETGEYTIRVVARSASVNTIEATQTITISGATAPLGLPITFDDANINYAFGTFNGSSFEVVVNPDPSGANATESNVGAITNSGNPFEGGAFDLDEPVDFGSDNKTIAMKFWSSVPVPVLLKFENGVNDERQNEVVANHGGTGWEVLEFNFAEDAIKSFIDGSQGVGEPFVPEGQYATMVIFVDGPGTTAGTFYIDDIDQPMTALPAPQLPLTFESMDFDYTWAGFGAADFGPIPAGVIDNPDASGINTSGKVVEIQKTAGAQTFAGASLNLDGAIDFSSGTDIEVKVWSPKAGALIKLKIEDSTSPPDGNGNPTVFVEVDVPTTSSNEWELLTFDMTSPVAGAFDPSTNFDRVVLFPDFGIGGAADESYYFDDIQIAGTGELALPQLPIDFEATNLDYSWAGFGAADFGPIPVSVIANPDASGINTSATVTQLEKSAGAQVWAGATLNLDGPIDFGSTTVVRMKVWSPRAGTPFLFKIEDSQSPPDGNGNPSVFAEIEVSTTVANTWEELSFDMSLFGTFDAANSYDRIAVFPDFNTGGSGDLFFVDDIVLDLPEEPGLPQLPIDFEATNLDYSWAGFGAADFGPIPVSVIANPDASGINTSATVTQLEKSAGAQVWAGATLNLAGPIDFSGSTTITMKVWSPRAGTPFLFKIEDTSSPPDGNGNPTVFAEIEVSTTVANTWEELSFDMSLFGTFDAANSYDRIAVFPDFNTGGSGDSFYIDDIAIQ